MAEPVVPGGRVRAGPPAGRGLVPLVVAVVAVAAVLVWLIVRDPADVALGDAAGPVAVFAAFLACHRVSAAVAVPGPVRSFWRLWSCSCLALFVSTVAALMNPHLNVGMPLSEAIPALLSLQLAMVAFRHAPLARRSALGWFQLLLDGAIVAIAGTLFFWYVVLNSVPPGTPVFARSVAGFVGVGCLLAFVVYTKVAASPDSQIDPVAVRILSAAPLTAMVVVMLFIGGTDLGRTLLSAVGYPVVGLIFCAAAYHQGRVLGREAAPSKPRTGRHLDEQLQFFAVAATAGLVLTVSARELDTRGQALIIGAVLIAAFVVTRQLLGLRQNQRLLRDVQRQQVELERLAMTDSLTGLANRTRFGAVLAERLAAQRPATVLLIDIDDFRTINDTMGSACGDRLLHQVAERLREHAGPDRVPARLGGDEFALLFDFDDRDAAAVAVAATLQALAVPFVVGDDHLLTHASAGVAAAGPGDTSDEVLRNADIAMYAAKDAGKATWVRYEPRMRHDVVNHARLGSELHNGILRRELFLLYQPIFDLVTGRMHGAESLVRWQHPVHGLVSPVDFIPVAERSGLIVPLGSWVLREACEQLARWRAEHGDRAVQAINVNVAARQLREPGFVDEVAAVLSETGLLPRDLVLEVTESSVVEGRQVRETLHALHQMGVRLALDDFGTGQSSLSLLRAFPVDVLKLDKSFVDGIADGEDRGRLAVAAAVAQLAEYLQLSAVAEGIESKAQMDRLRTMGYRLGQGFHLAKPLPPSEMVRLMTAVDPAQPAAPVVGAAAG